MAKFHTNTERRNILKSNIKSTNAAINETNISSDSFPFLSDQLTPKSAFKCFGDRLTACNGDCGSKISIIINHIAFHHIKNIDELRSLVNVNVNETIENVFWCYGSPLRNILINLMQQQQLHKTNTFYEDMYVKLNDANCFIQGNKWSNKMITLFFMLSINNMNILESLANYSCKVPAADRSLLQEIRAYYDRNITELKYQLTVIQSMMISETNKDIHQLLVQRKLIIQQKIKEIQIKTISKKEFKNKIRTIKRGKKYQTMKQMNLELSNLEILSIILYCDHNIFAYKMRESQRENHLNSCEWRTLFYYLHSAIIKIHKVFHFKNHNFYQRYIKYRKPCNNKLFRGIYNVSLNCDRFDNLSLNTITSFTECFGVAKQFASPQGMILSIIDGYRSIYNGKLIAANISWISKFCDEKEWIIVPVQFKSAIKINIYDNEYIHYIRNPKYIEIYEVNVSQHNCDDITICKLLSRIVMMLYWYNKKHRTSNNDNIVAEYIRRKENGYDCLLNDCQHIALEHYDGIINNDKLLVSHYGMEYEILKQIKQFIEYFDMLRGERKHKSFIQNKKNRETKNVTNVRQNTISMKSIFFFFWATLNWKLRVRYIYLFCVMTRHKMNPH